MSIRLSSNAPDGSPRAFMTAHQRDLKRVSDANDALVIFQACAENLQHSFSKRCMHFRQKCQASLAGSVTGKFKGINSDLSLEAAAAKRRLQSDMSSARGHIFRDGAVHGECLQPLASPTHGDIEVEHVRVQKLPSNAKMSFKAQAQMALVFEMHAKRQVLLEQQLREQIRLRSQLLRRPTFSSSVLHYWARHEQLCAGMHDRLLDLDMASRQMVSLAPEWELQQRFTEQLAECAAKYNLSQEPPDKISEPREAWGAETASTDGLHLTVAQPLQSSTKVGTVTPFLTKLRRRYPQPVEGTPRTRPKPRTISSCCSSDRRLLTPQIAPAQPYMYEPATESNATMERHCPRFMVDFFQLFVLYLLENGDSAIRCKCQTTVGRTLVESGKYVISPSDLVDRLLFRFQMPKGGSAVLAAVQAKLSAANGSAMECNLGLFTSDSDCAGAVTGCWLFREGLVGAPVGATKVGYLRKRNPRGYWQDRWFQLTADQSSLVYFQSHKDAFASMLGKTGPAQLGQVRMSRVASCYICSDTHGSRRQREIRLVTPLRKWYLSAETAEEAVLWAAVLEDAREAGNDHLNKPNAATELSNGSTAVVTSSLSLQESQDRDKVNELRAKQRDLLAKKDALLKELTGSAEQIVGRLQMLLGKSFRVTQLHPDGLTPQESGSATLFADVHSTARAEQGAYLLAKVRDLGGKVVVAPSKELADGALAVVTGPVGTPLGLIRWDYPDAGQEASR